MKPPFEDSLFGFLKWVLYSGNWKTELKSWARVSAFVLVFLLWLSLIADGTWTPVDLSEIPPAFRPAKGR